MGTLVGALEEHREGVVFTTGWSHLRGPWLERFLYMAAVFGKLFELGRNVDADGATLSRLKHVTVACASVV